MNICQQIVKVFDGSINVASKIDKGSVFTFYWKVEGISQDTILSEEFRINKLELEETQSCIESDLANLSWITDQDDQSVFNLGIQKPFAFTS